MIYVFDTSSFIVLGHYFPQRFPSFWQNLDQAVADGEVLSVREVLNELKGRGNKPHAARIPNVCDHFDIPWTSIEGFMEHMGWKF